MRTEPRQVLTLRVSAEERESYQRAADAEGRTLTNWLRWTANKAIEELEER
jgi:uncharacterized protein (DUF1778 family)